MLNLKELLSKRKNMSVVKRFIDNPDKFVMTMEVENEEIKVSIKEKKRVE